MYYAENPDAAHDIHELRVELLGQKMTFLTDAGVLARKWLTLEVNSCSSVLRSTKEKLSLM